ncbi:hypothetical protein ENBRE01_3237 [Enteropsectra breve]|nr:hypothetical protein ENBRE01_3237 [Enteropsectra breve]
MNPINIFSKISSLRAIILLAIVSGTPIYHQSPAKSSLRFNSPTIIRIPDEFYVTNYIYKQHPFYLIKDATIHKPLRKYFQYRYNADMGYCIEVFRGNKKYLVEDCMNFFEYNSQYVGMGGTPLLFNAIFKLLIH